MPTEFVVQCHDGSEDRLDRGELIQRLADDLRYELECGIDDQIEELQEQLATLSDESLAKESQDRTGEIVRIEESEEE